ncbi:hypothetical protein L0128_12090, partial [candidate division KSB1 bacterium]|nr:hypothetical protein [candidate division KSB1 bacterium]
MRQPGGTIECKNRGRQNIPRLQPDVGRVSIAVGAAGHRLKTKTFQGFATERSLGRWFQPRSGLVGGLL